MVATTPPTVTTLRRTASFRRKPVLRKPTAELFEEVATSPPIGGLELETPHCKFLLTPEVVLFEPSPHEIHRGGAPAPPGKPGTRLIFVNTPLTREEQAALAELHTALQKEGDITPKGDANIPGYVRLHALRILQQSKFDVRRALDTIRTHLEMRVAMMPISERSVIEDIRKGMMYWHGRDRKCRPCLVWRFSAIGDFNAEAATRMILFILEYGVRYCLVPGRVESWIVLIDLSGVGLNTLTANGRETAKNVTKLLEEVFCGRNYCTKIFHLPWVVRSIVNSLIPPDKKSKVEFVKDEEIAKTMRSLCEPHQIEIQYGGTAPNVDGADCYPFKFFPNACGPGSQGADEAAPLHEIADFAFHAGHSWDTFHSSKARWEEAAPKQALTPASAKALNELLPGHAVEPCRDMTRWVQLVNPEEARRRGLLPRERTTSVESHENTSELLPHIPKTGPPPKEGDAGDAAEKILNTGGASPGGIQNEILPESPSELKAPPKAEMPEQDTTAAPPPAAEKAQAEVSVVAEAENTSVGGGDRKARRSSHHQCCLFPVSRRSSPRR